jgi:cell shape-determining protein MreC
MADNGWSEYSRLVLKELETLSSGIQSLKGELQDLKQELTRIQSQETRIDELKVWKEKINEITTPNQLRDALKQVEELKVFKTRAITIFAVIQFAMAFWTWASKFV